MVFIGSGMEVGFLAGRETCSLEQWDDPDRLGGRHGVGAIKYNRRINPLSHYTGATGDKSGRFEH